MRFSFFIWVKMKYVVNYILPALLIVVLESASTNQVPGFYCSNATPVVDTITGLMEPFFYRELKLNADFTFIERNGDDQYLAPPFNRSGNWYVKADTLVLEVQKLLPKTYCGQRIEFSDSSRVLYQIRPDSLVPFEDYEPILMRR